MAWFHTFPQLPQAASEMHAKKVVFTRGKAHFHVNHHNSSRVEQIAKTGHFCSYLYLHVWHVLPRYFCDWIPPSDHLTWNLRGIGQLIAVATQNCLFPCAETGIFTRQYCVLFVKKAFLRPNIILFSCSEAQSHKPISSGTNCQIAWLY